MFSLYVSHSHSQKYDFKNLLYLPIRNSDLNDLFIIELPHEDTVEPFMFIEHMKTLTAIIAEVSLSATGQEIELDWASTHEVPIICIHQKGTTPARSLATVSQHFYEYDGPEDMIAKIKEGLDELGLIPY